MTARLFRVRRGVIVSVPCPHVLQNQPQHLTRCIQADRIGVAAACLTAGPCMVGPLDFPVLGQHIHAGAQGKIFGRPGAAVQHHDRRIGRVCWNIQSVVATALRRSVGQRQKRGAGRNGQRCRGNAGTSGHSACCNLAQHFAQSVSSSVVGRCTSRNGPRPTSQITAPARIANAPFAAIVLSQGRQPARIIPNGSRLRRRNKYAEPKPNVTIGCRYRRFDNQFPRMYCQSFADLQD